MVIVLSYQENGQVMAEVDQSSRMISQLTQVEQKSFFMALTLSANMRIESNPPFQGSRPSQSSIPEEDDAEEWFEN